MSSSQIHLESTSIISPPSLAPEESNWYAVHIMARHEKRLLRSLKRSVFARSFPSSIKSTGGATVGV